MYRIKECNARDFMANLNEINSFFQAKKIYMNLNNTERLLNLIKVYFETVLFYQKNSHKKNIVKIKGTEYHVGINVIDNNGNKKEIDILDISEDLIKDICIEVKKFYTPELFESLLYLFNVILVNGSISLKHKIMLINSENLAFPNEWDKLVRKVSEKLGVDTFNIRKKIIIKSLETPTICVSSENITKFVMSLNHAYINYLKILIKFHISKNHIVDIFKVIKSELDYFNNNSKMEYLHYNLVINSLFEELIKNNNLFQYESKEEIEVIINQYADILNDEQVANIENSLGFNPEEFSIDDLSIELAEPNFQGINENEIGTIISFVINKELTEKYYKTTIPESDITIEFLKTENLFDDPIYSFLDSTGIDITGMPITFLSDSMNHIEETTVIHINFKDFIHPDFEIEKDTVIYKDIEVEKAKHGGKYYPHKDLIIEIFFNLFNQKRLPFEMKKEDINSNLISNYLVSFINKKTQSLIHHKLFTITNFNTFKKIKERFLSKVNKNHYKDEFLNIKDLLNLNINNNKDFLDFCYKLLELTIKSSIEFSELHKTLWKDDEPISEPSSQIVIYNVIKDIALIKGIKITREISAADGSVDFHFHYNKYDESMEICVELKNAHHQNLIHGIDTQLPLYLQSIRKKEGIFMVLWYKCSLFDKPKKYNNITEIDKELVKNIPIRFNIKTMIIDCTPKASPSVKASKERLL